jgi:hypothetical protein
MDAPSRGDGAAYVRRHLRFGWWSLLGFLSLGIALEALHGFKVGWYLDAGQEARRLMWTLAHAHGALLGLVHVGFGLTLRALPASAPGRSRRVASACLLGASVLLPGGFFLGGVYTHDGDPGLGVLLVPVGAALLVVAVFLVSRSAAAVGRDAD